MLIVDVKDFREFSNYPVPINEEDVSDALVEAGVEFDTPFGLRLRIKDMDLRLILAKADMVDGEGDEFRLNMYFPPFIPSAEFVEDLNVRVRHLMCHMAQIRTMRGSNPPSPEVAVKFEVEACDFAANSTSMVVKEF